MRLLGNSKKYEYSLGLFEHHWVLLKYINKNYIFINHGNSHDFAEKLQQYNTKIKNFTKKLAIFIGIPADQLLTKKIILSRVTDYSEEVLLAHATLNVKELFTLPLEEIAFDFYLDQTTVPPAERVLYLYATPYKNLQTYLAPCEKLPCKLTPTAAEPVLHALVRLFTWPIQQYKTQYFNNFCFLYLTSEILYLIIMREGKIDFFRHVNLDAEQLNILPLQQLMSHYDGPYPKQGWIAGEHTDHFISLLRDNNYKIDLIPVDLLDYFNYINYIKQDIALDNRQHSAQFFAPLGLALRGFL